MLQSLFSPIEIAGLALPNRFVMAPMTRLGSPGGVPTRRVADYYRRRAEGEAGLIITEGVGVPHAAALGFSGVERWKDYEGAASGIPPIPKMHGEEALAGWRAVVDAVHGAGGKIAPQLWHQGAMREHKTGEHPDAMSARPSGYWGPLGRRTSVPQSFIEGAAPETRPMTDEEIADVIEAFANAARNARTVGFDAIAVHGGHGYMIDDFLWSETNRRGDRWGGDVSCRSRFAAAVVRAIRREIGGGMPIIFRFSQWKLQDFDAQVAANPGELEQLLGPVADAGADVFDASTRRFDQPAFDGSDLTLAGWARKVTGKLSMAVGSVGLDRAMLDADAAGVRACDNLTELERLFERGDFDLIGIGRMMVTHPDWVRRVRTGQGFDRFDGSTLTTLY